MAEGSTSDVNEDCHSISFGCDDYFDFYCESCKFDSQNVEAGGYCVNCGFYLCDKCVDNHKVTKGTHRHTLLSNANMPKGTPLSSFKIAEKKFTKCEQHGVKLEYYCNAHKKPVCHKCVEKKHTHCEQVEYILPALENLSNGKLYNGFVKDVMQTILKCKGTDKKAKRNIYSCKEHHKAIKETFKLHRNNIDRVLDLTEKRIDSRMEAHEKLIVVKMKSIVGRTSDIHKGCKRILKDVQALKATRTDYELFWALKKTTRDIQRMMSSLSDIECENVVEEVNVLEPRELLQVHRILLSLGTDELVYAQGHAQLNIKHVCDIDVSKSSQVAEVNKLTGSVVLPDNRLVIVSRNKRKVMLFDTNSTELLHELKTPLHPWDIAMLSKNRVAVTANSKMVASSDVTSCIYILEVGSTVDFQHEIDQCLKEASRGIAYIQDRLLVTVANTAKLFVMRLDGKVVKEIPLKRDFGYRMHIKPEYVCVGNDDRIYMSDRSSGKVICMDLEGVILSTYSDTGLEKPEKVCVDHKGNVYVSGYGSKNVHMLTADCKKVKTILKRHDGITSPVYTVSYCNATHRLFVGVSEQNTVKVYQMFI